MVHLYNSNQSGFTNHHQPKYKLQKRFQRKSAIANGYMPEQKFCITWKRTTRWIIRKKKEEAKIYVTN